MRLLSCKGKNDFELTTFRDHDNLPPYGILSHTWNDDQEVTFDELVAGTGREKTGYSKLRFCGEKATQDGLQYFWIDTCCIDKRDYTELSTAINSMFRWYQGADKCYVYLSDVQVPAEVNDVQAFRLTWNAAFRRSRWFTRGWTLQELLAPGNVEFFSNEGRLLGSKISLEQDIHDITQIPIPALRSQKFHDFSIDERMGWIEKRTTTVKEDRVYCLLGIFGIFLPLIYGEGEQHAFDRLRREIVGQARSHSESDELKQPSRTVTSLLPFSRNESFVGRESHIQTLENWLHQSSTHRRMSVYGLGGCGKTALAIEFAYRVLEKHPGYMVFWVPALNRETFEFAYREIGVFLGIPGITDSNADVKLLLKDGLSSDSYGDWLIIVDNADDTSVLLNSLSDEPRSSRLIDYLPRSNRGSILFTTRGRKTAESLTQGKVLELHDMSRTKDEAKQLMAQQISNKELIDDDDAVNELLELITYLPLAIMQMAAFINRNNIQVSEYLSLFRDASTEAKLFSKHFEDPSRYEEMESTIAKTWFISFNQLLKQDKVAADYLSFMACIDRVNIPLSLLPDAGSKLQQIEAIGTLTGYTFITERRMGLQQSRGEKFFDVHRLVHMASLWWLQGHNELADWVEKAFCQLRDLLFDSEKDDKQGEWVNYISHATYMANSQNKLHDELRADLLNHVGECRRMLGQYSASEMAYRQARSLSEKALGREHPKTLSCESRMVLAIQDQGRWKEAEELNKQVLQIRKRVLGDEHPDTLISLSNLAWMYEEHGRWKEAEELNLQTIEVQKRVLGSDHPYTLTSLNNLALVYKNQGRLEEAEELYQSLIEVEKRVAGEEHPNTVASLSNLALVYWQQKRWDEATELSKLVAETNRRTLGDEHPSTLTCMNNLAMSYWEQGFYKESEELYKQTIEIQKRVLGDEHPRTLLSLHNLAVNYYSSGQHQNALVLITDVVSAKKRALGLEHPDTVSSIEVLELVQGQEDKDL